jgi:hypothetical protein
MDDNRTRLSTLWVVVMFNMVFADILTFIKPGALQELWAGQAGVHVTQGLLLVFAVLLEIPIAMIFVSRILKPEANRWANTAATMANVAHFICELVRSDVVWARWSGRLPVIVNANTASS